MTIVPFPNRHFHLRSAGKKRNNITPEIEDGIDKI